MNVGRDRRRGVVTAFDEQVGLGQIRGDDDAMVGFHCVAIADGSRSVELGATVSYRLAAGLHGRWEAAGIEPLAAAAPSSPA